MAAAAAATIATVVGVSVGAAPAEGAVSDLSLASQAGSVLPAAQAGGSAFATQAAVPGPMSAWAGSSSAASPSAAPSRPAPSRAVAAPAQHSAQAVAATPHAAAQVSQPGSGHHPSGSQRQGRAHQRQAPRRHWRRVARPYLIYDSVTPSAIPAHQQVATYATGGYAVPAAQVAGRKVLWIDTQGTDPAAAALDVEPGDATPSIAATWVWHKLHAAANDVAIIYTMRSEWPAVQAAVGTLPAHMRSHVRWWIADPTGVPHIVPGANATQWYWGSSYDITTANPGF